jgi:heme-degrading monooxygenase HmoA
LLKREKGVKEDCMVLEMHVFTLKDGKGAEFEALLKRIRELKGTRPGPISTKIWRHLYRPNEYIVLNEFERKEDDVAGERDPEFIAIRRKMNELTEKRPDKDLWELVEIVRSRK